jgi:phage terminase large subunit
LGERGISEAKIYNHWQLCDKLPDNPDEIIYGLDFGYNNPSVLIKIAIKDKIYYWHELIYESYLTNTQLIEKFKIIIKSNELIYADSAEPQRIEEIKKAGFNIKSADKDVKKGIDIIKTHKWFITKNSINTLKEVKNYSWKMKDEKITDEPIKINDHAMDAGRYAIHSYNIKPKIAIYI